MRLEKKGKKQRIKGKTMAQWINLLWYNSFVNRRQLLLLCEKTGAIALALLGLMAGRHAGRKIVLNSKFLKIIYRMKYLNFLSI